MEAPEPGIYPEVSMAVYESWEAARHSTLALMTRSPAHAHERELHPSDPTPALVLGQAIHACILEPQRFEREFVPRPKIDRRTKIGKAQWTAFEAEYPDSEILSQGDYHICVRLRDSAARHPTVREIMSGKGYNELSVVYEDRQTGVTCKIRPDRLVHWDGFGTIVDIKSTENASRGAFARSAARYNYHSGAWMYLDALDTISPRPRRHLFIAVEKEPPWQLAVLELDPEGLEQGQREHELQLELYAEAIKAQTWKGYPTESRLFGLPRYAIREDRDDD